MSGECFVPNCKNTVGAPFPKDQTIRQEWLEGLKLKNVTPKADSFVCFDHFESKDLNNETISGTRPSNRLKKGAIPTIRNPQKEKEKANGSKENLNEEEENAKMCRVCMAEKNLEKSIFDFMENEVTIMSVLMICAFPLEILKDDMLPKFICKECFRTLEVAHNFRKKCLNTDEILHKKFSDRKATKKRYSSVETTVEEPLKKFKKTDSNQIRCKNEESSQNAEAQKHNQSEVQNLSFQYDDNPFEVLYEDSDDVPESHEEIVTTTTSKEAKEGKTKDPLEIDVSNCVQVKTERRCITDAEVGEERKAKTDSNILQKRKSQRITVIKDLGNKEHSFTPIKLQKQSSSGLDDIERNMEAIHGRDTIEIERAASPIEENYVGAVANKTTSSAQDILSTLTESSSSENSPKRVVIGTRRSEYSFRVKTEPHPKKKIVVKTAPLAKVKKENVPANVKLPKDIKIKAVEKQESTIGRFPCVLRSGVYDTIFVMADDYLFEYGLMKNNVRHLKCAVPNCMAHAEQKLVGGAFEDFLEVKIPHNHPAPNEATKKKQMFLCVMRRKIQTDKTLNIRNVYEDVCLQDPEIRSLVPLRNVVNEICRHQLSQKMPQIHSFEDFYKYIEGDYFEKLHFTHSNQQFYQEQFSADDGSLAIVFANTDVIHQLSDSKIMYVDASFKIDTQEDFKYQLVTILVWIDDSYYPILFALVNKKTQEIFKMIFSYLHDALAPRLRPHEIITDYEANLYYALAEVYVNSNIGGSVFYYTQNLYKKVCSLNLSRDLETNSYFRNIYHMLLMLPLLPVNTILDGLNNIELEARHMHISELARPLFDHIRTQWIINVTPDLFCVHKLENRINENVIAPFKKLRDFLLLTKGKMQKMQVTITHVIEKIIELEAFLRGTYSKPDKKSFGRDLSSFQKKNVLRAWQYIEDHPKIEINNFFGKVLGYIKCMENQLWIWGFYRYDGDTDDILINASHFSIVGPPDEVGEDTVEDIEEFEDVQGHTVVMEAVVDQDGVLQTSENMETVGAIETVDPNKQFESAFLKYVYQE